jgi:hypothetical protein
MPESVTSCSKLWKANLLTDRFPVSFIKNCSLAVQAAGTELTTTVGSTMLEKSWEKMKQTVYSEC